MDATQLLRYKTVLFVLAFLVLAAPGWAQGQLLVSTNTVNLPGPGGVQTVDVSVTSSDGSAIAFTLSSPAFWYTVANTTGANTTPATLQFRVNFSGSPQPSSTFTITGPSNTQTITVNYTPGGGPGPGTGLITANPNPLPLSTTTGGIVTQNVTLSTSSTTAVNFTVSSSANSGSPLFITSAAPSAFTVSSSSPVTLAIQANAAGLANGFYTNTVTVTPTAPPGAATNITVQLTVGGGGTTSSYVATPNIVNFAFPTGTQSQSVLLTSNNAAVTTYNATATSSNGWLLVNGATIVANQAVGSVFLSVNAVAAGQLTAGTYPGTVTITNPSNASDFTTIGVQLSVSGGTLPNLTLTPTNITINAAAGSTTPITQSVAMSATNAAATNWTFAGLTGTGLTLAPGTPTSGTLPASIAVQANPTGLGQGTYPGSLNVTFSGGVNGTQSIPVTLVIGSGGTGSGLPAPSSLTFSAQAGSLSLVPPQSITVPGTGAISVSSSVSGTVQWLFASGSGNAPGVVVVNVSAGGLAAGSYTGTVTITSGFGSTNIPVTLNVTTGAVVQPNPATINLSNSSLIQISVNSSDNSNIAFTATSSASWVTVTTASGTTPGLVSVNVNVAGLPGGANTANVILTAAGAANSPVTVPVVALVEGSAGGGVTVSPTSLTFNSQVGGSAPAAQALSITSATAGVPFTVAATSTGNWLSAGVSSGTTNTSVNISVNPAGLAAGQYSGTITVTPTGGTAVTVPVTLNVTAPAISATPTSLTFDYRIGDPAPAAKTINVSGSGSFSATAQSTGNWLAVSPASGTAPATLNVTITNLTSLTVGTVTGTIVVAGTGGATGSTTVTVTLNVTAPLPTIDRVTNAASFLTGPISPGEIITIFGTGIGPTPATGLSLDSSGRVSTTSGGVQVLVNGIASPMVFASATQVSAVVPYEVKGFLQATVQIRFLGQGSNVITQQVAATAPGLFTANSTGSGPVAFLYSNPSFATPTRGDVISIFATGEGETSPAGVTGKVTTVSPTPPITPAPLLPVGVTIDGMPAEVLFVGEAPTFVSGLLQLNVRIPANAASGNRPIQVTIGGVSSQTGVTVNIR